MEEDFVERKVLTTFEKHDEFVALQDALLFACTLPGTDVQGKDQLIAKLSLIVSSHY